MEFLGFFASLLKLPVYFILITHPNSIFSCTSCTSSIFSLISTNSSEHAHLIYESTFYQVRTWWLHYIALACLCSALLAPILACLLFFLCIWGAQTLSHQVQTVLLALYPQVKIDDDLVRKKMQGKKKKKTLQSLTNAPDF